MTEIKKSLDPEYPKDKLEIPKAKEQSEYSLATGNPKEEIYPTETVDLPSKGLAYPESNPLSSGTVELRYMTAKEEDILTSQNLIQKGVVIDKLLKELIVSKINYNDLLLGDKNAIMVAARILAYGKNYQVEVTCPACGEKSEIEVDLTKFTDKQIDESFFNRENRYTFMLPASKKEIEFKFLTVEDDNKITEELKFQKNFQKKAGIKTEIDSELSTRLKYMITAVDGNREPKFIRSFVDKMLSLDTAEFRKFLKKNSPDIDLSYNMECPECGAESLVNVPMRATFFWPDARI